MCVYIYERLYNKAKHTPYGLMCSPFFKKSVFFGGGGQILKNDVSKKTKEKGREEENEMVERDGGRERVESTDR